MKKYCLVVTYHAAAAGGREEFLEEVAAEGIRETVLAEEGCLKYDYYLSADDPCELVVLEEWTTVENQQAHVARPHMARLREIKNKYMTSTVLQTYWNED